MSRMREEKVASTKIYRYVSSKSANIWCSFKSSEASLVKSAWSQSARVKFSRSPVAILCVSSRGICISHRHGALQITTADFIERTNNLNRARRWVRRSGLALSKAGREVSIRSDLIANSNTPDKRSSARSLIARGNLHREARKCRDERRSIGEGGRAWSQRRWFISRTTRKCSIHADSRRVPARMCACARVCVPGSPRLKRTLRKGLRALLCATGASWTNRAFRLDPPFPVLKDRIYCDNSFRSIVDRPALNAALLLFPQPESSTSPQRVLHRWNGCEGSRIE